MKCCIAIIVLVSAGLIYEANAVRFVNIERFWTASPTNSIIYTTNQSEREQKLTIKKRIDKDHPLLIDAVLTHIPTNEEKYRDQNLNVCSSYEELSFQWVAVRLFNRGLIKDKYWNPCPVEPINRLVHRYQPELETDLALKRGNTYEMSYTAKSKEGEIVFSTVKFRFQISNKIYYVPD